MHSEVIAMVQFIKDYLVRLGPDNALVQTALRLHSRALGYGIEFANSRITVRKATA